MKYAWMFLGLIILTTVMSCGERIKGNGNTMEAMHDLPSFDEVDIEGVFEVELIKGTGQLEIIADENLHEHIDFKVVEGVLKVDSDHKYLESDQLLLRIHYETLKSMDASGAIQVKSRGPIKAGSFDFDVSGACSGELELEVERLDVDISGGGELKLNGFATDAVIEVSGAGDIDAEDLEVKFADISIAGAGDITLFCTDRLDVDIKGAGDVKYRGTPKVSESIAGAGSIKKMKE